MSKALVIDDEHIIRKSFKKRLEKEGITVDIADGWEEAEPFINSQEYDIVFSDIKMPGKSGIEILKIVMELQPEATVVLMTGDPSTETAAQALRYGAAEYLEKPVTKEQLLKITFRSIERRKLIIERRDLLQKNEDFQDKIDKLLSDEDTEFDNEEFKALAQDLVKHRQKSSDELKGVQNKLGDALKSIRSVKDEDTGENKSTN